MLDDAHCLKKNPTNGNIKTAPEVGCKPYGSRNRLINQQPKNDRTEKCNVQYSEHQINASTSDCKYMSACVTLWKMEHIQIISKSSQKVASSKYLYNAYWFLARPGGVNITTATKNIGIYRPHVFCVGPGPNQ